MVDVVFRCTRGRAEGLSLSIPSTFWAGSLIPSDLAGTHTASKPRSWISGPFLTTCEPPLPLTSHSKSSWRPQFEFWVCCSSFINWADKFPPPRDNVTSKDKTAGKMNGQSGECSKPEAVRGCGYIPLDTPWTFSIRAQRLSPCLGGVPEGGEPGEPGVGLSSTRPSSLCRARCRTTLSVLSRFSLAARSLVMLSFRSSGSSKECMVTWGWGWMWQQVVGSSQAGIQQEPEG